MRYMLKMQPPREGLSALMLDAMQVRGWLARHHGNAARTRYVMASEMSLQIDPVTRCL